MFFKEKIERGVAILSMRGNLLSEPDAVRFRKRFHDLVSSNIKHVIIDLGEVNYINSIGLGALVSALTTVRKVNGDIRLACLDRNVIKVFMITRLVQIFEIYDSVDQALIKYVTEMEGLASASF